MAPLLPHPSRVKICGTEYATKSDFLTVNEKELKECGQPTRENFRPTLTRPPHPGRVHFVDFGAQLSIYRFQLPQSWQVFRMRTNNVI